jgi:hypothetical protein
MITVVVLALVLMIGPAVSAQMGGGMMKGGETEMKGADQGQTQMMNQMGEMMKVMKKMMQHMQGMMGDKGGKQEMGDMMKQMDGMMKQHEAMMKGMVKKGAPE